LYCHVLVSLDLYGATVGPGFIRDLLSPSSCTKTLEVLDVTHCSGVSSGDLERAFTESRFPKLRSLALNQLVPTNVVVFSQVAKQCPALRHLVINLNLQV